MNQVLKCDIYGQGTKAHEDFLAFLGGMTDEEKTMLSMFHKQKQDLDVELDMNIDRKTRVRVENSMRRKLLCAVMHCINYTMTHMNKESEDDI